jgi:hypothetical protein
MIQACSMFEKVATGLWFYTYALAMKFVWHIEYYTWVASGATTDEYNRWFAFHTERLGGVSNCVFVGTDFSKYDVTQGKFCKLREHAWYKHLGFLELEHGGLILRAREKLKVYGSGWLMKYFYRRQSGSNDTTSGNNKTTAEAICGAYLSSGVSREEFAIAVIGDDNYTIMTSKAWARSGEEKLVRYVSDLGFKLKIQVSANPTEVEFVSCRFFPVVGGYAIGKKPGRVLCKMGWMLWHPHRSVDEYNSLLKGSMLSYRATGMHVPFLRVYLRVFNERLASVKAKVSDPSYSHRLSGETTYVVCKATWDAFELVYGLTREDERVFERKLRKNILHLPMLSVDWMVE